MRKIAIIGAGAAGMSAKVVSVIVMLILVIL